NHVIFRIVAATRAIAAMTSHISVIFHTNLTHLIYWIPETASTPISDADVGMIVFAILSPVWYARTAACLGISLRSALGVMFGIVVTGWPEPDGMKNVMMTCMSSTPSTEIDFGR